MTAIGGIALAAGPALAADLPTRKGPPVAPVVYAPVFTWTGFYVGINAGGAWSSRNNNASFPVGFNGANAAVPTYLGFALLNNAVNNNNNRSGFTGGGQVGYNYQIGSFVIGGEADINYLSTGGRNNFFTSPFYYGDPLGPLPLPVGVVGGLGDPYSGYYQFVRSNNRNNNNYFGTVRARLGWAIDRTLLYLTGGLAYGGNHNNNGGLVAYWGQPRVVGGPIGAPNFYYGNFLNNNNNNNIGWTVGAGAEYAFTNNWTVKLEYLYANFGGNNHNLLVGPTTYTTTVLGNGALPIGTVINLAGTPSHYFVTGNRHNNINIVRVGLNYKF
jgi:outer membrane immunogenic protein